jgi:hypothetical protein
MKAFTESGVSLFGCGKLPYLPCKLMVVDTWYSSTILHICTVVILMREYKPWSADGASHTFMIMFVKPIFHYRRLLF